jgi:hypothetical protein
MLPLTKGPGHSECFTLLIFFFLFLYISKEMFCASFGIRQQSVDSPVFSPHHRPGILWCSHLYVTLVI